MVKVRPFRGVLPDKKVVDKVAAVPYDVVNREEAAALASDNPFSFLRISRPEIELSNDVHIHDECVYLKAKENFDRLYNQAPLNMDSERRLYLYTLCMGDHMQTGIVCTVSCEDYKNNIIKKHEKTRPDKEEDRMRHILALRSHTGPVFLTYRDNEKIEKQVSELFAKTAPYFDITAEDKVRHQIRMIEPEESFSLSKLFETEVPYLYIADGHHRAAAAVRVADYFEDKNSEHAEDEEYKYFLAVVFPASQLRILAYNRVVRDLNGMNYSDFITALSENFSITENGQKHPGVPGEICMYLNGVWRTLTYKRDLLSLDIISRLDVSILQNFVLAPLLGIDNPRTSKKIDFVGGIRGVEELERLVDSEKYKVAFSMYPTAIEQLLEVADTNEVMPPKSTWFEPKLRDGLVCHNF